MAWPPTIPPADITNSTPQIDRHADDHNEMAAALAEIVPRVTDAARYVAPAQGSPIAGGAPPGGTETKIEMTAGSVVASGGSFRIVMPAGWKRLLAFVVMNGGAEASSAQINYRFDNITSNPFSVECSSVGTAAAVRVSYFAVGQVW